MLGISLKAWPWSQVSVILGPNSVWANVFLWTLKCFTVSFQPKKFVWITQRFCTFSPGCCYSDRTHWVTGRFVQNWQWLWKLIRKHPACEIILKRWKVSTYHTWTVGMLEDNITPEDVAKVLRILTWPLQTCWKAISWMEGMSGRGAQIRHIWLGQNCYSPDSDAKVTVCLQSSFLSLRWQEVLWVMTLSSPANMEKFHIVQTLKPQL